MKFYLHQNTDEVHESSTTGSDQSLYSYKGTNQVDISFNTLSFMEDATIYQVLLLKPENYLKRMRMSTYEAYGEIKNESTQRLTTTTQSSSSRPRLLEPEANEARKWKDIAPRAKAWQHFRRFTSELMVDKGLNAVTPVRLLEC
ncbi:hypothetical protein ACH5RR_000872 [Cinchona calisaya]|uniref:Uncharacterized protein n=1 Tax=Cinchona calisaya TaxID=153742 RepID=A0ABD3B257_9GENT